MNSTLTKRTCWTASWQVVGLLLCSLALAADEAPQPLPAVTHQITGLFSPDRAADLKMTIANLPDVKIEVVSIDYDRAEASLRYDSAKLFPGAKPDQVIQRLDSLIRTNSSGTFGVKPLRAMPLEQLTRVEIGIVGLDCKACSFAVYEMLSKIPGVELATVSFKEGRAIALIDPQQTNQAALEDTLKKRNVTLKP